VLFLTRIVVPQRHYADHEQDERGPALAQPQDHDRALLCIAGLHLRDDPSEIDHQLRDHWPEPHEHLEGEGLGAEDDAFPALAVLEFVQVGDAAECRAADTIERCVVLENFDLLNQP